MRPLGIFLVVAGLSPLVLTVVAMIRAFNGHSAIDDHLMNRAFILTACGLPLLICGIVLQLAAAFKKSRTGRIR